MSTSTNNSNASVNLTVALALSGSPTAASLSVLARISSFLQILYFPLNSFFLPLILVLAAINDPLCLAVFLFSREFYNTTAKNARLYYILLSVADIVCIIGIPLPWFLGDGLYGLTGGNFFFYPDQLSTVSCIAWRYLLHFPECISSWSLVCLNADRLLRLTWPFWARAHLGERNTKFVLLGIVGRFLYAMSLSFFAINCYAIVPTVANKLGVSCIGTSMGSTWYYVISPWMLGVFGFTAPTVLMMFLIVALFRKVVEIRTGEKLVGEKHSGGSSTVESRQGNEALAIVLTISVCHFIVYTPFPIIWTIRASLGYLFPPDLYNFLAVLQRIFLDLSEMVHVWNIYFYMRIPAFRNSVFSILSCGFYKSLHLRHRRHTLKSTASITA